MSDLKPCPFLVRVCTMDGQMIGYTCKKKCAKCPVEKAKDREIDNLKAEVTRYRRALHNLKEDCQKRLHWKNSSWERLFLHEVITHIDAELDFAPDTGKMEESKNGFR